MRTIFTTMVARRLSNLRLGSKHFQQLSFSDHIDALHATWHDYYCIMFNEIGYKLAGLKCGIINYDEELQEIPLWINPLFQGWQQMASWNLSWVLRLVRGLLGSNLEPWHYSLGRNKQVYSVLFQLAGCIIPT